jgi:hypothetical protein
MKEKNVAVSDFAKNNTILEQRKLLPIFSCRDALMAGAATISATEPECIACT